MKLRALLLCALVGCTSGNDEPGLTADEQAIVDCARVTVYDLARIAAQVERILAGDVALTPVAGTTFDYTVSFDGTTMSGQVTFPRDPAEGTPTGEDVGLTLSLAGPLQGSGNLTWNFADARRATLRGGLSMRSDLGCSSSLLFEAARPFEVEFTRPIAGPAPAAEVLALTLAGPIDASITAFEETPFAGDLELAPASQDALLDGLVHDRAFRHVFSVFPDALQRAELATCLADVAAMQSELFGILEELTAAIDAAGADLTALPEIPGFTVTPVSSSNADYEIDAARFGSLFTAGTIRGGVRLTRINFETTGFWSWRIDAEIGEDRAFGQSARFYEIAVDDAGTNRASGEGTLGRGACGGSFDEDGLLTVRAGVGPHTLAVDYDGGVPVAARIDGIPVPLASILPP